MRLNITKQQLGDFLILLIFDRAFDEDFIKENEVFNELMEKLDSRGIQSLIFNKYFDVDASLRGKYKQWRNAYDNKNKKVSIEIFPNTSNEEELIDFYKEIITETARVIIGKESLNKKKLKSLQEEVLYCIMKKEEEEQSNE